MKKFIKISFLFVLLLSSLRVLADDTTPPDPITCAPPQILNSTGDACIDPTPTCTPPQILVDNVCTDPALDPTPAPVVNVNLTIRDSNTVIGPITVPLQPTGTINLNDSGGTPHSLNADSVLSVLNDAQKSASFSINFVYEYGSVYLKCINSECGHDSIGWEYAVNSTEPGVGMDQYTTLKNGDNIYLYFGQNHQIILSASSIATTDALAVTAQNYHYQDNTWIPLAVCPTNANPNETCTIGLTQPNPADAYNPIEVQTKAVDTNGIATFSNIPTGTYNVGIKEDYYYPTETLTVTAAPSPVISSGGGGGYLPPKITPIQKSTFDLAKATDFLLSQQKADGSFGEDLYTDWAAMALASNPSTPKTNLDNLVKYFNSVKIGASQNSEDPTFTLTDYERHAMALMALGLNPYDTNGENYITDIISKFDGSQFGDKSADNDDIFALIVLQNAGYAQTDKMINDDINFVLNKQNTDGSWDENADLTGAGMEALTVFNQNNQIKNTLIKAEQYLKQNQKNDGGWQNVSSTAWAMEGISALGENPAGWTNNGNTPLDSLAVNQDTDGGIKDADLNNKIWETSYTLTAMSEKTWNQIMQKFNKPIPPPATSAIVKIAKINTVKKYATKLARNASQGDVGGIKINNLSEVAKIASQNPASVINVVNNQAEKTSTGPKKQSWFRKFFSRIFGF